MTTYVLIHGAGSDSWYWHRVTPVLRELGHDVVTVDLPVADDSAGLEEYAQVVVEAVGDRSNNILVAQSMAGFTAPLVCDRIQVDMIVLLNAMIPSAGESPGEWWENAGQADAQREMEQRKGLNTGDGFDPQVTFLHDLSPDLVAESTVHTSEQSATPFEKPWPLAAWPDVPTKVLVGRDDRFFPLEFQKRIAKDRLGIEADEIPGGHLVALNQPLELVTQLEHYRLELAR